MSMPPGTSPEDEAEVLPLKEFFEKYKDEAGLLNLLQQKDTNALKQARKKLESMMANLEKKQEVSQEVPSKEPTPEEIELREATPKEGIDKDQLDKALKILDRQIYRRGTKKPIPDKLLDFLMEHYPSGAYPDSFKSEDKEGKPLILRALDSGNSELFRDLLELHGEGLGYGKVWWQSGEKDYWVNKYFAPLVQGALKAPNREIFSDFLKFCFGPDPNNGKSAFTTLLAKELYFNVPDRDKDPESYKQHMENRALFEQAMERSELNVDNMDEIFKAMIDTKQLELAEKLKYYSNFANGNEVLRVIEVLANGIKQAKSANEKNILYDLIGTVLKQGLKMQADKDYYKGYEEVNGRIGFFNRLNALDLFSNSLQDDRKELTAYLTEIFAKYSKEEGKTLHPFSLRDLVIASRPGNDVYLKMIEGVIGSESHNKVKFLLDSLAINDYTEQDFLNIFALPLSWSRKEEDQLFARINSSRGLLEAAKYNLKKTFEKTREIAKKTEVEKIYADIKAQNIVLDTHLFGNIHNDPNFQGTNIQGGEMTQSIRYLNELIDKIHMGAATIPGLSPAEQKSYGENLLALKSKLSITNAVYDRITQFLEKEANLYTAVDAEKDGKGKKEQKDKIEAAIKKLNEDVGSLVLNELKSTGSVLIPGGWGGLNQAPGHAMLYEFKIEDGNLVFLVHNMGDGIRYHAQKRLLDKEYHSSVRAFKCPYSGNPEDLPKLMTPIINSLIKPRYLPATDKKAQDSKKVYSRIKKTVLDAGMQEVDPFNYSKEWVVGQLSGTCFFRVFESFLSSYAFKDPFKYDDVHYEIMRSSLQEFFDRNMREVNLEDETVKRQLNYAVQNFAIMLQELSEKSPAVLSDERIEKGRSLINDIYHELNKEIRAERKEDLEVKDIPPAPLQRGVGTPQVKLQGIQKGKSFAVETEDALELGDIQLLDWTSSSPPKEANLEKLREFLSICQKNFDANYHLATMEAIEKYFLEFPYKKTDWSKFNEDALGEFLKTLRDLQYLYGESAKNADAKPFAERTLTMVLAEILGQEVFQAYHRNNPKMQEACKLYLFQRHSELGRQSLNSPYFMVLDPKFRDIIPFVRKELCPPLTIKQLDALERGEKETPEELFHLLIEELDEKSKQELENFYLAEKKAYRKTQECVFGEYLDIEGWGDQETIFNKIDKLPNEQRLLYLYLSLFGRSALLGANTTETQKVFREKLPILGKKLSVVLEMLQMGRFSVLSMEGQLNAIYKSGRDYSNDFWVLRNGINFDIKKSSSGEYSIKIVDPFIKDYYTKNIIQLTDTQNEFSDPDTKKSLESRSTSSNSIQVETMEKNLSEKVSLLRILKNIRLSPATQVVQTLDFIKSHLFKLLLDKDLQLYTFLSLFQAPLLEKQLEKTPGLFKDFLNIMQEGIKKYSKNDIIKPEILFFYRMALSCHETLLNRDEKKYSQNLKNLSELEEKIPAILSALEAKVKSATGQDAANEDLLYEFHMLNVEALGLKLQEKKPCTAKEIFNLIASILYIKNHKAPLSKEVYFSHLVQVTLAKIQAPLNAAVADFMSQPDSKLIFEKELNKLAHEYDFDATGIKAHWELKASNLTLIGDDTNQKLINFNLTTGSVSRASMGMEFNLSEVIANDVFKSCFNLDEISGFAAPDRNRFEFKQRGVDYRLIIKPKQSQNKNGALQRKVQREGISKWYELCTTEPPIELPLPLQGINLKLWVGLETLENGQRDMLVIDQKTDKPLYQYDGDKFYELDAVGRKSNSYLLDNKSLQLLLKQFPSIENFEDPKFIMAFKSDVPPEIKIVLPRYNLSFVALGDENYMSDLILEQDPRYKLKTTEVPEWIPNFPHSLTLESATKEAVKDQVLIPEQQFLATAGHEKEYYRLEFDRNGEAMSNILVNKEVFKWDALSASTEWRNSEHYARYTVSKSGAGLGQTLEPDSSRSRFYLAYLYLSRRQPILANQVLKAALHEDNPLTEEDLSILKKILLEIPADLQGRDDSYLAIREKAIVDSPEIVAVRMQVLALLSQQKMSDYKLHFKEQRAEGGREANAEYQALMSKQLKEFWESRDLHSHMLFFMKDYLKKLKYIPADLKLDAKQELQIIRFIMLYYKKQLKEVVPPNILYRRRVLELNLLLQEQNFLQEQEAAGKLSTQSRERLRQISERIASYPKVTMEQFQFPKDHDTKELLEMPTIDPRDPSAIPEYSEKDISFSWLGKETVSQAVVPTYAKETPLQKPKAKAIDAEDAGLQNEQLQFHKLYEEAIHAQEGQANINAQVNKLYGKKEIKESVLATLYNEDREEYRNGLINNLKLKARREASEQYYHQYLELDSGKSLSEALSSTIHADENALKKLEEEILKLANQEPTDPKKRGEWLLKKASRQQKDLKLNDILRLFLQRDEALYKAETTLDDAQIHELQQKVFDFLMKSTNHEYQKRLFEQLQILGKKKVSKAERTDAIHQIGMLLSMKRCYPPEEHPEILLFEYLDNKIIYPEQYHYLQTLMKEGKEGKEGYVSQVIKLIMGGGKSKVLLPVLALEKAKGNNLVVLEVPQALFEINRADLNITTVRLFGREAKAFIFNESVKLTSQHLLNLKRRLRLIMQNRDYLVTTKESMQALELKYLKLLRECDPNSVHDKLMIKHLSDILNIFKNQGDFLIDEVDSTLDIRKQLIYTVGSNRRLGKETSSASYEFFEYLDSQVFTLDKDNITLKQILAQEKSPTKEQWPQLLQQIVTKFINDPNSPLLPFLELKERKGINDEEMKELTDYFLGKAKSVPEIIKNLSADNKEIIAFYKLQLESLLVSTLSKKKNENFGRTKDLTKPDLLQEIAIPYAANDTPNEKSRFKNAIETLNYTFQMQYGEPVSKALLKKFVAEFKAKHEQEEKKGISELKSGAEAKFFEITGVALSSIELSNEASIEAFSKIARNIPAVKKHCMINYVFHSIEESEEYLASDAHNHCGQGRSIQGMTGTDWNKRCLPKFIETKQALTGSDGQVIDYLSYDAVAPHKMSEPVTGYDKTMAAALKLLESNPKKSQFRAWIDLGAHFRGVPNRDVALGFAEHFKNHPKNFANLKFVLYFESTGKLYAAPTAGGDAIPLEESSPDYIKAKLGVGPDNYFTFYDQLRTTGTDIKQAKNARAFVSLSGATLKRDLLQAVMRMRELRESQRVEFVVPKELQDLHPDIEWTNDAIVQVCSQNEAERLAEDHYRAALQEMKQLIRNDCLTRILSIKDVAKQKETLKKFNDIFFSKQTASLFKLYGEVTEPRLVSDLLKEQKKKLVDDWIMLIQDGIVTDQAEQMQIFDDMETKMQAIVNKTIPFCYERMTAAAGGKDLDVGSEVQAETEAKKETTETTEVTATREQTQELTYGQTEGASAAPQKFLEELPQFPTEDLLRSDPPLSYLQSLIESGMGGKTQSGEMRTSEMTWKLSSNLFASESFKSSLTGQTDFMDAYKKNASFLLVQYTKDAEPNSIKITIITPEEAKNLGNKITGSKEDYWIETPHQTLYRGNKPEQLPPEYHSSMEQIAFFNGDSDLLYRGLDQNSWLKVETDSKLKYFDRVIMPHHEDKPNLTEALRTEANRLFKAAPSELFARKLQVEAQKARPESESRPSPKPDQ